MALPSGIDADDIAAVLTAFVNANLMARGRRLLPDDDFERAGVDSMGLLKVLLFIEAEFGFWMPDEDLVEENVASPRTIATYICRKRVLS
ncbi:MAG TPA: acyl carrier protein [Methylomirabilota bacterium]|jgi:acyl carrier protein|nr:acyl carrier protein [Methylomirabilota bacterium]